MEEKATLFQMEVEEAGNGKAAEAASKQSKAGVQCTVCEVWLPSAAVLKEHEAGKRHQSQAKQRAEREELGGRSVFAFGFPAGALDEDALCQAFAAAFHGPVASCHLGPKGTSAILVFQEAGPAQAALKAASTHIQGHSVQLKPREMQLDGAGGLEGAEEVLDGLKAAVAELLLSEVPEEAKFPGLCELIAMDDLVERQKAVQRLQLGLRSYLPEGFRVEVHGSCVSGLGLKGCDLDSVLFLPKTEEVGGAYHRSRAFLLNRDPQELREDSAVTATEVLSLAPVDRVRLLARLLNHARKTDSLPLSQLRPVLSRRCPTVSLVWEHRWAVDLSLENEKALRNARWLGTVATAAPIFRELSMALRFWGKTAGIVGGEQKVTSYALSLVLVTFLRDQGIVGLSDLNEEPKVLKDVGRGEALCCLMALLSALEWKEVVVSPKRGRFIPLAVWKLSEDFHPELKVGLLNVQDPFDLAHNTAAQTALKQSQRWRHEISKAAKRLEKKPAEPLKALFNLHAAEAAAPSSSGKRTPGSDSDDAHVRLPLQGPVSPARLLRALRKALGQGLGFRLEGQAPSEPEAMETGDGPAAKVARREPAEKARSVEASVWWRSWQGRRLKLRALARDRPHLQGFPAEVAVTQALAEQAPSPCEPLLRLSVAVEALEAEEASLRLVSLSAPTNDFATLTHFAKPFLLKHLPALIAEEV